MVAVEAESIGLPFARTVLSVTRTCQGTKPGAPEAKTGVRYFVTSLAPAGTTKPNAFAELLAGLVRKHWGIENKNHWKRDALWGEDRPRFKNPKSAHVLAVLRGALLALINEPAPALFARGRQHLTSVLHLITSPFK